tara:strand:+ start:14100 stop:14885 length:786 start_codon:yes stop_codon:yes gene_type:complete
MPKNILNKIYKSYKLVKVKKPSSKTKIENTFGLLERFLNLITPPIAYYLNRLNISADLITLISFGFIGLGAFFFLSGNSILGSINWFIFGLLDSLDGDLARLRKKTLYGTTLDSFGADIFYFTFPFVIGFYLFIYTNHNYIFYSNFDILIISFITSFSLTGYRIIGSKRYILFLKEKKLKKIKPGEQFLSIKKVYNKIDNEIIRINLFGEPGIILNFLLIALFQKNSFFYYYLILISFYSSIRLFVSIIATYISFRKMNSL